MCDLTYNISITFKSTRTRILASHVKYGEIPRDLEEGHFQLCWWMIHNVLQIMDDQDTFENNV